MTENTPNTALIVEGIKQMKLEKMAIPEKIKSDEVLLRVKYCGICGSDMHIYEDGHIGSMKVETGKPFILGHES
ncbi:hypothetical protein B4U80_05321, partial [Leptotrombidium deliense]